MSIVALANGRAQNHPGAPPVLTGIVPSSGAAGMAYPIRASLQGSNFMPTGNVVKFGPVEIPDRPSAAQGRITFDVPKVVPSRGEAPPAVLSPGPYKVTVTTSAGTSNALTFTLTR
jgi:hypothetical protein